MTVSRRLISMSGGANLELEEKMPAQTVVRKCRALILVLAITGLLFASSQAQARKAPPAQSPDNVELEIIEKDARPKTTGNEYLYFRLYTNGAVEFESSLADKSPQGIKLYKVKLKAEDRDELFDLDKRCLSAPMSYDPMQRLEEKNSITRIRIRDEDGDYRQIMVHSYSPENEKTQLYFPENTKKLLQKVEALRWLYLHDIDKMYDRALLKSRHYWQQKRTDAERQICSRPI